MVNIEDVKYIESASTIQAAREVALSILFKGLTIADRRAQLRAQVQLMGTKQQMVQLCWSISLNQQGYKDGQVVKSKKGMAYKR